MFEAGGKLAQARAWSRHFYRSIGTHTHTQTQTHTHTHMHTYIHTYTACKQDLLYLNPLNPKP
jgi:hypothetical protein